METERLPLEQCAGRFLAKDIFAPMDNPPFDRSALDGYAVRSEDIRNASPETPVYLQVCDAAYAGRPSSHRVEKGCALRIMTGAVMPEGADCVVRQEDTDQGTERQPSSALLLPDKILPVRAKTSAKTAFFCRQGAKLLLWSWAFWPAWGSARFL